MWRRLLEILWRSLEIFGKVDLLLVEGLVVGHAHEGDRALRVGVLVITPPDSKPLPVVNKGKQIFYIDCSGKLEISTNTPQVTEFDNHLGKKHDFDHNNKKESLQSIFGFEIGSK